jgi:hypothetical protein
MAMSSSCAPASTSLVVSKTFTAAVELPWGNPTTGAHPDAAARQGHGGCGYVGR